MFVCRYGLRTTDSKRISYWNAKSYITRHVAFYVHSAGGKWITGIRDAIGPSRRRRAVVYERVIWTHENRWLSTTTPSWNGEFRCSGQWHRNSPFHDGIVVDSRRFSWVHITRSYTTARRDGPMASRIPVIHLPPAETSLHCSTARLIFYNHEIDDQKQNVQHL